MKLGATGKVSNLYTRIYSNCDVILYNVCFAVLIIVGVLLLLLLLMMMMMMMMREKLKKN
jgi:hypothetical protein